MRRKCDIILIVVIKEVRGYENIKARNVKQLVKKILLCIDIRIYLKLRK